MGVKKSFAKKGENSRLGDDIRLRKKVKKRSMSVKRDFLVCH